MIRKQIHLYIWIGCVQRNMVEIAELVNGAVVFLRLPCLGLALQFLKQKLVIPWLCPSPKILCL